MYPWLLLKLILFLELCCWKVGKRDGSKTKPSTLRRLAKYSVALFYSFVWFSFSYKTLKLLFEGNTSVKTALKEIRPCKSRSSHQRWSVKKVVLKSFVKFTGKHLCSLFFNKVAGMTILYRTSPATASVNHYLI